MPGREKSLDIFDKFIGIAKEIAKLLALVLPQYSASTHHSSQALQTPYRRILCKLDQTVLYRAINN